MKACWIKTVLSFIGEERFFCGHPSANSFGKGETSRTKEAIAGAWSIMLRAERSK